MIHDIGRTLFALCLPKDFARIDPLTFIEDERVLELENQVAGTNHCEVGAWFAQLNHLPESLIDVIQFHHQPNRSNHNQTLVSLIAVSDEVANFLQRSNKVTDLKPEDVPSLIHLEASGVENAAERFHAPRRQHYQTCIGRRYQLDAQQVSRLRNLKVLFAAKPDRIPSLAGGDPTIRVPWPYSPTDEEGRDIPVESTCGVLRRVFPPFHLR